LENTGVRFCQGTVSGIDVEEKRVQLHDGPEIPCDRLVLALGGETPLDMVKGAVEYAYSFRTLDDAYRLEERLRFLEASNTDKIRVAIVGAGYSGVELACKLADRLGDKGRVRLVEQSDMILRTSPEFNREAATKALEKRKVWIDLETEVEAIEADTISLLYKGQLDVLPVDIVLWTVGTQVSQAVRSLPLKQNRRGQLI
ncbi:FAD-dependent oxidoreductase, partial [Microcoleus sp. HI-ES]|nr:FAD-dependent oxidoreductase [Microcoleus sp. HI-ES]